MVNDGRRRYLLDLLQADEDWFTISISDHLDALTTAFVSTIPAMFPQDRSSVAAFLLLGVITEALAIVWLTREGTRSRYLGRRGP